MSVELASISATIAAAGSTPELLVFFVIGLLAGAHCLGMCGPLVSVYAKNVSDRGQRRRSDEVTLFDVRQHTLFNLGRAGSYAVVGGLFGLLGGTVFATAGTVGAASDGVRGLTGILVGAIIVLTGLYYVLGRGGPLERVRIPVLSDLGGRVVGVATTQVGRVAGSPRIAGLGAVHALLPCPIIYPAYLSAFAVGDPIRGALALGVLGLGTIPTLLAYALAIGSLGVATRTRLHRVLGVAFLVLGYLPLQHGLMQFGIHLPHPPVPYYQPL